ncbi:MULTISPECIES: thymidylate synthase [unclassified Yoonia]|uniref:thymidylate synthase n=1 Tax=unclassified Yoonia TaxID=2629118 RepID=UPI002AFEC487|nr:MULTISPECIES: thymidylate synthase [unclassified Yoonia]
MKNIAYAVVAMAALTACDGVGGGDSGPGGPGGPTDPGTPPPVNDVPAQIAGDLKAGTFNPADGGTMIVRITLDADVLDAVYTRNSDYDVPGYLAFTTQDDPLDRFFTAFGRESSDGSVQAVLAADGGQFTKYFGGATYRQTSAYTAPSGGLASYAGDYVGTLNVGTREGTLPSTAPAELRPLRSFRVSGQVFLNADFTDGSVNGAVYNRRLMDDADGPLGTPTPIETIFLIPAAVATNGSFSGVVENIAQDSLGSYAGIFGGTNASSVAGGIRLEGDFLTDFTNEEEYGIFVLDRCGTTPTICLEVDQLGE